MNPLTNVHFAVGEESGMIGDRESIPMKTRNKGKNKKSKDQEGESRKAPYIVDDDDDPNRSIDTSLQSAQTKMIAALAPQDDREDDFSTVHPQVPIRISEHLSL